MNSQFLKATLAASMVCLSLPCWAQPFIDLLNLTYLHFQPVEYKDQAGQLTTKQLHAVFMLPLEMKNKKDIILISGAYDRIHLQHELAAAETTQITQLHGLSLRLGGIKTWNEKWKTMGFIIPKIATDGQDISEKDLQLGGAVVFTRQCQPNFAFKFGLYYNREYFGNFFMPLIGWDWRPRDRFRMFGVLPGDMNLEYRLTKRWYSGLAYQSITQSFRMNDSMGSPFIREGHKFWGHNQLKAFVNYYPFEKWVVVFAELGHTSWRSYDLYQGRKLLDLREPAYQDIKDGFFLNVGIAIRVRLDQQSLSTTP